MVFLLLPAHLWILPVALTHWAGCFAELHKRLPNKKKIVWMLLVFSHFFVPTMQLCPLGRSVLRLNTECYFPHPISVEQPRLCRDSRSPHPTAARDRPCFGTTRPPQEAEPAPNRATHTGNRRGIQGDQTSADDSSNPSRDWLDFLCTKRRELLGGSPLVSSWNTWF